MMIGLDGGLSELFRPATLSFVQGGDTIKVGRTDAYLVGAPRAGLVDGQFRTHGILVVDTLLDPTEPFTMVLDLRPGMGLFTAEQNRRPVVAARPAPAAAPAPSTDSAVAGGAPTDSAAATAEAAVAEAPGAGEPSPDEIQDAGAAPDPDWLTFEDEEEETVLARTLASTDWVRFGLFAGLLGVVSGAFVAKRTAPRWVALAGTMVLLGFSGGFLSVSHLTSLIKVGPSVFLTDLPLLLLVVFTLVTTLLWGRVFCGFLCPFGALQDVLDRVVPKRFRRELPQAVHDRALWIKYGILALILGAALAGMQTSIFQYFEPFGTVFFLSRSWVLWTIAGGVLVASAVVPRFYCRYACPLGAALAVTSKVSPFRIPRVEQCGLCKVCERRCPTGAIRGAEVDFKECVRCNVCETQLIEKAGVCKHDMEAIRPRLVQLKMAAR